MYSIFYVCGTCFRFMIHELIYFLYQIVASIHTHTNDQPNKVYREKYTLYVFVVNYTKGRIVYLEAFLNQEFLAF